VKVAILTSGNLGFSCINAIKDHLDIICVFTDSNSKNIIEWCSQEHLPIFCGNPRKGRAKEFVTKYKVDIIFSINYLFIIDDDLLKWPALYAFNIHGSLLPKYRGRTPHVWAIINNEKIIGFTVHLIDEHCDSGDIVLQREIDIEENTTGADVLTVFERLYPDAIIKTYYLVKEKRLVLKKQNHSLASYFGKRTPEDGEIDWNWQKERIHNWVRAQTRPYPGAFTFYQGEKLIIYQIAFDAYGFQDKDENGKIMDIQNEQLIVKTPNGAIRIIDYEFNKPLQFIKGNILHARNKN
jgi:methionyl-tRNA formyltransferase